MGKGIALKIGSIVAASTFLFAGGVGIATADFNGQEQISTADSYANGTQTKVVNSMYGKVTLKVSYVRNLTKGTSEIKKITSYSNTDTYLKYVNSSVDSKHATVTYYDKTHEVYVTNTIWASECK